MKKTLATLFVVIGLGFVGCNPDDTQPLPEPVDTTGQTSSLSLTIDHKQGANDLAYYSDIVLPSLETVQVSRLAYILGHFYLVKEDGTKLMLDDQYALIEGHKDANSFVLTDIPYGTYKAIGFSLGLDSTINHGDPNAYGAGHPLAPFSNSLHWGWTNGYIFTALEGKVTTTDESFVFHLAGVQNKLDFELEAEIISSDDTKGATITYDFNEIFSNPDIYNIANDGASSHSITSPVTRKLISNMSSVFTGIEVN